MQIIILERTRRYETFGKKLIAGLLSIAVVVGLSYGQPPYAYTNADIKTKVPEPVIDGHQDWISLYYFAWQLARDNIHKGTTGNQFVAYWMDEAFDEWIYQWDSCFMMYFGRYAFPYWPSIVTLENFYKHQYADGYICRAIHETDATDVFGKTSAESINPPLYSWAEWGHFMFTADTSRFMKIIHSVKDNSDKTVFQRLINYFNACDAMRKIASSGLYTNNGTGSGMDNTSRTQGGSWICMSAQMALNALCISKIAKVIGDNANQQLFYQKFTDIKNLINAKMWDNTDQFYYDLSLSGQLAKVKSVASFWPMLAEVSDQTKNGSLYTKHLTNQAEFWRSCPFPTLAATEPAYQGGGDYWLGSVWAPTNYMTLEGLRISGYDSLACVAAERWLIRNQAVYQTTGTIWENYSADFVRQGSTSRGGFVGWGGLGPITALIEFVIGIVDVSAPDKSISWRTNRIERNGIKNLYVGKNVISMIADARTSLAANPTITVTCTEPFTLNVINNKKTSSNYFPAGTTIWTAGSTSGAKAAIAFRGASLRQPSNIVALNTDYVYFPEEKNFAEILSPDGRVRASVSLTDASNPRRSVRLPIRAGGVYLAKFSKD